jgi:DNA-binding transcriptional ArsR family regulator
MTEANGLAEADEADEADKKGADAGAADLSGRGTGASAPSEIEDDREAVNEAGPSERRSITDARTMRALAHPMRMALLELLTREGELTATRAAELLGESPGNMSWHLQTLAKYGFVEEAEGARGRSRPWRAKTSVLSVDPEGTTGELAAAEEALESIVSGRSYDKLRDWWATRGQYPAQWRRAAFSYHTFRYLTPEEMSQLSDEINEVLARFGERTRDRSARPPGAQPVQLIAYGHPIPPTPEGN